MYPSHLNFRAQTRQQELEGQLAAMINHVGGNDQRTCTCVLGTINVVGRNETTRTIRIWNYRRTRTWLDAITDEATRRLGTILLGMINEHLEQSYLE
jgi:hypothetical protein